MKLNILMVICFSVALSVYSAEIAKNDFQNDYKLPVVIDVPNYEDVKKGYEIQEQILQPGDYYQSGKGENGYVFKQYGLMPDLATNVILSENNKIYKNFTVLNEKREKEYKDLGNKLNAIVITNCVSLSPGIMEVKRIPDRVVSNEFYITNLTDTNVFYTLYRSVEGLQIISFDTSLDFNHDCFYFTLEAKQKAKFYMLFDFKKLPTFVQEWFDVELFVGSFCPLKRWYSNLEVDIKIKPFFVSEEYKLPKAPEIISPKNGQRFTDLTNVKFEFKGNISNKKRYISPPFGDGEYIDVVSWLLKINSEGKLDRGFNRNGSERLNLVAPYIRTIEEESAAIRKWDKIKDSDEFFFLDYRRSIPGNYIWRIQKESVDDRTVVSDWGWLSVGEKISKPKERTPKGRSIAKNMLQYSKKYKLFFCIEEYTKGIALEGNNMSLASLSNAYFAFPLPKGIKLEPKKYGGFLKGVPEEIGRFTNYWIGINRSNNCNVETQKYIFVVHNDQNKIVSRSFYHLNKGAIVHDLTVNVPFKFKTKEYYDEFYKMDGLAFDSKTETKFRSSLPLGLNEERKADGDLAIIGTPKESGTFTNVLVISSNDSAVEQKHIFRIQDIGEPPAQKKIRKQDSIENDWYDQSRIIYHNCYIGIETYYCLANDVFWYKPKEFTKEFQYELLNELPKGLKIAMHEPDKRYDHYKLPPLISICGEPQEEGVFTTVIKYKENGKEFERKHIFRVKKEPAVYEVYDLD